MFVSLVDFLTFISTWLASLLYRLGIVGDLVYAFLIGGAIWREDGAICRGIGGIVGFARCSCSRGS